MKSNKQALLVALCTLAAARFANSAASAATFQYDSYTVTNKQTIHILTPNNISGGIGQTVLHGAGANTGQLHAAWCLDIYDFLSNAGTYTVTPMTTGGSGGSNPSLTTTQMAEIGSLMVNGTARINTDTNVSAATQ